ncbi:NUDIX domain-containing protein [Streptosporangium sp. NPDC051023]|uniref:NUDIX domain-containing protein n=1 Tax=Streptosporangium sp. NPDC051023 TaxID=3155410 RepID=UPI00344BAC6F
MTGTHGSEGPTITYTHPDVLTTGVRDGWADPETDPTEIDWPTRQARAGIRFEVVDDRPLNPCRDRYPTGIRHGRNQLGHWGEALAADAFVTAIDEHGRRWLVMVERMDGHGWALPGGYVNPDEVPLDAAVRELTEETGLDLSRLRWEALPARYVPDPRASDEAWMVTMPARCYLGTVRRADLPIPAAADDAARAEWVRADTYPLLATYVEATYGGKVFAAHQDMLTELLADNRAPHLP